MGLRAEIEEDEYIIFSGAVLAHFHQFELNFDMNFSVQFCPTTFCSEKIVNFFWCFGK
jgi:hypothetical protein